MKTFWDILGLLLIGGIISGIVFMVLQAIIRTFFDGYRNSIYRTAYVFHGTVLSTISSFRVRLYYIPSRYNCQKTTYNKYQVSYAYNGYNYTCEVDDSNLSLHYGDAIEFRAIFKDGQFITLSDIPTKRYKTALYGFLGALIGLVLGLIYAIFKLGLLL